MGLQTRTYTTRAPRHTETLPLGATLVAALPDPNGNTPHLRSVIDPYIDAVEDVTTEAVPIGSIIDHADASYVGTAGYWDVYRIATPYPL